MKLIIDIGNTRIKAALFDENKMVKTFVFDSPQQLMSEPIFTENKIAHCLVASVVNEMEEVMDYICKYITPIIFTAKTQVPLKNLYQSAHTLGSDRLAAAVGGNAIYRDKNVLVIDAGTCIKYNFVNENNEYLGGGISPGLQMRFKSLREHTSRLPLLNLDEDFYTLIGTNSNDSILSGIQLGAVAEVDGIIDQYKLLYNNLTVVLTGGDFNFFVKRLKNSIFADQFLILKGLNAILDTIVNAKT